MKIPLSSSVIASIAVFLTMPIALAQTDDDAATQADDGDQDADQIEEVIVTGTRLSSGDSSQRVDLITSEDIEARGASTLEDIIRTIPGNFSSLNTTTNRRINPYFGDNLGELGLGTSAANLRGLGSENTLVLVNGRRVAGINGQENGATNLENIPASAIELVEVLPDGASAVYGSDAIGGVINIILKDRFSGAKLSFRYENSSTDSDSIRASAFLGRAWGSGSVSGTIGYEESDPISNAKTGWTTTNHASKFGGDTAFDLRDTLFGQPGFVGFPFFPGDTFGGGAEFVLPAGNDGTSVTMEDFIAVPFNMDTFEPDLSVISGQLIDNVPSDSGSETEKLSITANFKQEISSALTLKGSLLWSRNESSAKTGIAGDFLFVPSTNAFNPFLEDVIVSYLPLAELQSGLISEDFVETSTEQLNLGIILEYYINDQYDLTVDLNRSTSEGDGRSIRFTSNTRGDDQAFDDRVRELLASSDASVAVNPFGNGTAQNASIAELVSEVFSQTGESRTQSITAFLRGTPLDLPAGPLNFVFGGEYREEALLDTDDSVREATGGTDPERDLFAGFAEVSIPIFSDSNKIAWVESLTLSGQIRYDRYSLSGAVGMTEAGDPNLIDAEFSAFSPRIGLAWAPIEGTRIRASWGRSFRAPSYTDLFRGRELSIFFPIFDVLAPGGPSRVTVETSFVGNPDVEPETSDNYSFGIEFTPPGFEQLLVSVSYGKVDFEDRIISTTTLASLLSPAEFQALSDVYIRDAEGNLLEVRNRTINQAARVVETLDLDVTYWIDTSFGLFRPSINLSYFLKLEDQFTEDAEPVELLGTARGNDEYRLQGSLHWRRDAMSANLFINYIPEYENNFGTLFFEGELEGHVQDVDSYTTVDLTAKYTINSGTLRGMNLLAGARNLFDADFPLALIDVQPFDGTRVDLRGRVLFLDVSYEY